MKKAFMGKTAFMVYSVLIAILLWTFVVYNQNPDTGKTIRGITTFYTNADALAQEGLVVLQDKNPTVSISVKGRRLSLARLDNSNISASITVPELQPGTYDVPIDILLPIGDVTITDKNPYTTRVIVESIKRVELPIEITQTGGTKNSDTFIKTSAVPEKIELWGPGSVINRIASLQMTVDLDSLSDESQNTQKYAIIDQNGEDMTANPNIRKSVEKVSVLHTKYNTKNIGISVDYGKSKLPDGYVLTKTTIIPEVVLLGSVDEAINAVTEVRTGTVDISHMISSKKITVPLSIPSGIVNVHDISSVEISFSVERVVKKQVNVTKIDTNGAKDNLSYRVVLDDALKVDISGAESLVASPDIGAAIDVSALDAGEFTLPVTVTAASGITVEGSYMVNVVVTQK